MHIGALCVLMLTMSSGAFGRDFQSLSEEEAAERAKEAWESGAVDVSLEILAQGIRDNPGTLTLRKLRGDVLATTRRLQEAVGAYDEVLAKMPTALNVRWAKWGVLVRSGQAEEAVAELRQIAQVDPRNPLVHLRLAQELRKIDRLEESLESYKKAVELVPDLLSWRLALARARFDVLDYQGAYREVQQVLQIIPHGSPLEIPAKNLLAVIYGPTTERGRRWNIVLTPEGTGAQRQEWASIRSAAWKLFAEGRYQEAEPIYRRVLELNPGDSTAAHQLGLILMELGRCEEALAVFHSMSGLDPSDEEYADAVFRMGQCLVELGRWSEALVHFQILYEAAVEFEQLSKNVAIPPGTRVLDKNKLARWIEKVLPHVPEAERPPSGEPSGSAEISEEELYAKIAAEPIQPQKPLDTRASLMGKDADFSWFRFVIPAPRVMRDDSPTGAHEFIPIDPSDSFPTTQQEIYLVFGLVSASYDAVPLTAQCFLEASEIAGQPRAVAQDRVIMSTNDQSGYFLLSRPDTGWKPGLYRCGLFEGERTSAYAHVDEVRFRIVEPGQSS